MRNSSYSFIPILLKLYQHYDHATVRIYSSDLLLSLFCSLNLVIFRTFSHLEKEIPYFCVGS